MNNAEGGVENRWHEVELILEEYNKKLYLNKIQSKEVDYDIPTETLRKMSSEDIYYLCKDWTINNIATQKAINRQTTIFNWADTNLNFTLCKRAPEFDGFSFKDRKEAVLVNDSYAKALYDIRLKAKAIIDDLSYITGKIDSLIKIAMNIVEARK